MSKRKLTETLRKLRGEEPPAPRDENPYRTWGAFEHITRMGDPNMARELRVELGSYAVDRGQGDPLDFWLEQERLDGLEESD